MASLITELIPAQSFEVVHDRIGEILTEELDAQFLIAGDYDLDIDIWKERDVPFNHSECPAINVMLDRSQYVDQSLQHNNGVFRYIVEIVHKAPSKDAKLEIGDSIAMTKVQKIMGKCRYILEHTKYKTLGFTPPFIQNRHVEEIYFGKPVRQDSAHVAMGRMVFSVKVGETNGEAEASLLRGYDTTVKLYLTEKGYLWKLDESFTDGFDYRLDSDL